MPRLSYRIREDTRTWPRYLEEQAPGLRLVVRIDEPCQAIDIEPRNSSGHDRSNVQLAGQNDIGEVHELARHAGGLISLRNQLPSVLPV